MDSWKVVLTVVAAFVTCLIVLSIWGVWDPVLYAKKPEAVTAREMMEGKFVYAWWKCIILLAIHAIVFITMTLFFVRREHGLCRYISLCIVYLAFVLKFYFGVFDSEAWWLMMILLSYVVLFWSLL
jgi:hypothetical protein